MMIEGKIYSIADKVVVEMKEKIDNGIIDTSKRHIYNMLNTFLSIHRANYEKNFNTIPKAQDIDDAIDTANRENMKELLAAIYYVCGDMFFCKAKFNIAKDFYIECVKILVDYYEKNPEVYAPYYIFALECIINTDVPKSMDSQSSYMNMITTLEKMVKIDYDGYISVLISTYYAYYKKFQKERADMFDIAYLIAQDNPNLLVSINIIKKYKHKYPFSYIREKKMIQARTDRLDIQNL